jgi:hypothetical protein
MSKVLISIILLLTLNISHSQYNDPNFSKPTTGYGSDGTHTVGTISFTNPNYLVKNIEIYYPSDIATKVPTIFYSHAFGGNNSSNISGMLEFVAKKGYAIVYVPYKTVGSTIPDRYTNLLEGFRKAARDYPNIIDTTQVGFMGHSFGGGASFGNAYKCFNENNWGQNGRFIYALAQWYSFNITQAEIQSFPSDTKVLIEVFNDDETNDHRMAIDIFNTINITSAEKDFILLESDTINGYTYTADHIVPNTANAFDALDYYAYYRFIDALSDYTFNGNGAAKDIALGNGSIAQVSMPTGLKSLSQSDNPIIGHPESKYQFPCSDAQNLRSTYCAGAVSITEIEEKFIVYPNPASDYINLNTGTLETISIYSITGVLVRVVSSTSKIDISNFINGSYFLKLENKVIPFVVLH